MCVVEVIIVIGIFFVILNSVCSFCFVLLFIGRVVIGEVIRWDRNFLVFFVYVMFLFFKKLFLVIIIGLFL